MLKATLATLALLVTTTHAAAQNARARPFEIADNSLLVEEAFNQEAGIFQNIFLFQVPRAGSAWSVEFTQEWPLGSQRHQFSFTVPFVFGDGELGNVLIHYRLQARLEDDAGPALSPRLSLILPTGRDDTFEWGAQFNLPASKQLGDLYLHVNAGTTFTREKVPLTEGIDLISPHLAGSVIWRALPMVHLLLESVASFEETRTTGCCGTERETALLLSPGFRAARNLGTHQLVVGAGVPLTISGPESGTRLLLYVSYELPFKTTQ